MLIFFVVLALLIEPIPCLCMIDEEQYSMKLQPFDMREIPANLDDPLVKLSFDMYTRKGGRGRSIF